MRLCAALQVINEVVVCCIADVALITKSYLLITYASIPLCHRWQCLLDISNCLRQLQGNPSLLLHECQNVRCHSRCQHRSVFGVMFHGVRLQSHGISTCSMRPRCCKAKTLLCIMQLLFPASTSPLLLQRANGATQCAASSVSVFSDET